jgi:hypothetical protein
MQRFPLFLAALWWGGIAALSFLAVPLLFARLGAAVAGPVAAQLFALQAWASVFIGLALVLWLRQRFANGDASALTTLGLVLAAMLLALVQEFGVAHKIVTARATGGDLRLWHGMGSAMVLGQWLCAGAVLWRLAGRMPHTSA